MRSLWTAASGMIAQQTNVDTISNNLANVNTIGYKKETVEFKSLLYQTIQTKTTTANGEQKPIGAQVGLGTRNSAITSVFTDGNLNATGKTTDMAISGNGFFAVTGLDGETYYTRNGSFNWAIQENTVENGIWVGDVSEEESEEDIRAVQLSTSDGLPVLDTDGEPIILLGNIETPKITIQADGTVCYPDEKNNPMPIGKKIGLYQFSNPAGLSKAGSSLYKVTAASGNAREESQSTTLKPSKLSQGYIEASNVQVVDEMVNLIVAQRAYEINSKAIQAADDMLQQANNLKR